MGRTTSPRLSRRGETQLGWSFGVAMTDTLAADSGSAASHDSASPSNVPLKDLLIAKGGPRSCAFVPRPSPLPNARCQRSRLDEVRLNSYGRASPSCRRRARSSAFERAPTAAPRTVPATRCPRARASAPRTTRLARDPRLAVTPRRLLASDGQTSGIAPRRSPHRSGPRRQS